MSPSTATAAKHETVTVTFNGHDNAISYQPQASLSALLAHAKQAFAVQSNHLLSLFTEAGVELTDNQSGEDAGVLPGALLILRQSTVRGGRGTPLTVAPELLERTFDLLRDCGAGRRECVAYWCADVSSPDRVVHLVHPRHLATGFGYEVEADWVTQFFLDLRRLGRTVRAQVHTHPRAAGHSSVDDDFALAPATGFISLVIPDFASGPVSLDRTHLVEMRSDGQWEQIEAETVLIDA